MIGSYPLLIERMHMFGQDIFRGWALGHQHSSHNPREIQHRAISRTFQISGYRLRESVAYLIRMNRPWVWQRVLSTRDCHSP